MIDPAASAALERYLSELATTPVSVSSVTGARRAWEVHVLDSLEGLRVDVITAAGRLADLGSGGGFPGVPLATALPDAQVDLVESVGRKCEFMERALARAEIANARVVNARAEQHAKDTGRERYDAVTVRAVGRLAELAELASPLLREGGSLVAWKGRREAGEEAELNTALEALAMAPAQVLTSRPYRGSGLRHLYVLGKIGPTPEGLPRRPGMARKRSYGR